MRQIRSQFDAGRSGALAAPTPTCCCCCCCVVTIATSSAIAAGTSYALSEQAGASAGRRWSLSAASAATVLVGFALFAVPGMRIAQPGGLIAAALIAGAALYLALSELWRAQGAAARVRYPLAGLIVGTLLLGTPLEVMGILALAGLTASIGPVGWAMTILYFALAIGLSAVAGREARRKVAKRTRA